MNTPLNIADAQRNAARAANTPSPEYVRETLELALELCKSVNLADADARHLVPLVKAVQNVGAFAVAIDAQIQMRAITNGLAVPGVAVKDATVHRVWNDEELTAQLAQEQFGDKAFSRKLLSPAGIEKLGSEGKALVAMCSRKPEAAKKVVY